MRANTHGTLTLPTVDQYQLLAKDKLISQISHKAEDENFSEFKTQNK